MNTYTIGTICHNDDDHNDPQHRRVELWVEGGVIMADRANPHDAGLDRAETLEDAFRIVSAAYSGAEWDLRILGRWTPQVQRLYAADCAERVLSIADDERCVEAVHVARLYALGRASEEERRAAQNAAYAAAEDAPWAAAEDAARASAEDAPRDAASAAAQAATWYASWAVRDEAEDNERAWQIERLFDWLEGRRTPADVEREIEVTA